MSRSQCVLIIALTCFSLAWGQNTVTGAGYTDPIPLTVAPGQVVTIFVQGVGASLSGPVVAPGGKLPTTLAGISVTVSQGKDYAAPILQVRPIQACNGCVMLTAITIQIPYEVTPPCPLNPQVCPVAVVFTALSVTENGTTGSQVMINIQTDEIHILTACDTVLSSGIPHVGLPCQPMVTHANGTLVTAIAPASPGEQLVAYAVGLGATNPAAATGQPASGPVPTSESFTLDFNYHTNALATRAPQPVAGPPQGPMPLYAGLTPGYAGLYQINFVVPTPPSLGFVPGCVDPTTVPPGADIVQSNFTVSVIGRTSFDGAGICVSVPAAAAVSSH